MKKKIPSVALKAMRKYPYTQRNNIDMYDKNKYPDWGLEEWLFFNPWESGGSLEIFAPVILKCKTFSMAGRVKLVFNGGLK